MSLRVGLTGGIGSGKSTVAGLFAAHGAPIIDMDAICHALIAPGGPCVPAVLEALENLETREGGAPDRDALRERIFRDAASRTRVEAILHPAAFAELEARCRREAGAPYCILVIPLLVEVEAQDRVDRVLTIDCSRALQLQRTRQRGLSRVMAERILDAQARPAQRLAIADDHIDNNGSRGALDAQVRALHHRYLAAARGARLRG